MTTTFDSHTAKFLSAVAQNMPKDMSGDVMQGWIDNPRGLQNALRVALCPPKQVEQSKTSKVPDLKIWKTIKLGTGIKKAEDFRQAITSKNLYFGDSASDILDKPEFTTATEEQEVDLVRISANELVDFEGYVPYDQVCEGAKRLGLDLCPAEVGPQLRLQYLDQPKNEWIIVGMEPICDSQGNLDLFRVEHEVVGRGLAADYGDSKRLWLPTRLFVFVLPRQPSNG